MTPAGTSNELDVQNEWEENTHTHTHTVYSSNVLFRQELNLELHEWEMYFPHSRDGKLQGSVLAVLNKSKINRVFTRFAITVELRYKYSVLQQTINDMA